jgi:predicted Zn-dependent peptidase
VKEEKRQRMDNQPYGSILTEILKHAYKVHPYQWPTIGSLEHLNAATLDEFIDFYKTFYVPNNATLSIVGDIDINTAKAQIAKYFKDIPKGTKPVPRPTVVEPQQTKEVRDVVLDNIQLPAVVHAYHMPAQGTDDSYALDMLSTLLSGGESSRLYKALVDEQKKAYVIQSFPFSSEDPGLYLVFGLANMGVPVEDLEKAMDEEIQKVMNELITEKEFQKVKNQVESQFVQQNSSMVGVAEQLANYHVYFKDSNLINTEIDRYNNIKREDLEREAKK